MQTLSTWQSKDEHADLEIGVLHVWRVDLDSADTSLDLLDAKERERAARFTAETAKRNFICMRTALRTILSRYSSTSPKDFSFELNRHGKPYLAHNDLSFNMSHSGGLGLIAISAANDVGVDIEQISSQRATRDIANRFFSTAENKALSCCSDEESVVAFFRCWSRKEAVIKALGEGLTCPLSSFDVSLDSDSAELLEFRREGVDLSGWNMVNINTEPEFEAAAAVVGKCDDVKGFLFS